jgi:Cu-Zn family superoxide dismutase
MGIAGRGLTRRAFTQRVGGVTGIVVAVLAAGCSTDTTSTTTRDDTLQIGGLAIFAPGPNQASARLVSKSSTNVYGIITFRQSGDKVGMAASIFNLNLGPHSLYIHETGNCSSPNAASAGPVWNVPGNPPGAKRSGHLPELYVGTEGNSNLQATITGVTVGDGKPTDIVGRAVVVHESLDPDPKPQYGGRPNGWIACGVIKQG